MRFELRATTTYTGSSCLARRAFELLSRFFSPGQTVKYRTTRHQPSRREESQLVTGTESKSIEDLVLSLGAIRLIRKPIDVAELHRTLREISRDSAA